MLDVDSYEDVTRIRMSRVLDGKPLYWVAAYLVDDVLIDSGCDYTKEELLAFLGNKGVKRIVNTHYHEDHIGANALLQEALGAKLYASTLALDLLEEPAALLPYEELVWGHPAPSKAAALGKQVVTERHIFEVIPTPGHTPADICLFEPACGWLFSGDLYVSEDMKVCRPEENQWQIIESLKRLHELQPRVLFTGTGSIVADATTAVERRVAYLQRIGQRVLQLRSGGMAPADIVIEIFGRESSLVELTQGHYSCRNLVESFLQPQS